jgi:hypothetical protein
LPARGTLNLKIHFRLQADIAGEAWPFNLHTHPADDKAVANFEVGFQIMGQGPAIIENDGVGPAQIVDVKTVTVKKDGGMLAGNMGIAQDNVAGWMAANGDWPFHVNSFPLPATFNVPFNRYRGHNAFSDFLRNLVGSVILRVSAGLFLSY